MALMPPHSVGESLPRRLSLTVEPCAARFRVASRNNKLRRRKAPYCFFSQDHNSAICPQMSFPPFDINDGMDTILFQLSRISEIRRTIAKRLVTKRGPGSPAGSLGWGGRGVGSEK